MKILIKWEKGEAVASLKDTATVQQLLQVLPVESVASTWGDEVYFSVPVSARLEADARQGVPPGTVGFWTEGSCLALPYGPTPISVAGECRLAARVNILGQLEGDPAVLSSVRPGDVIAVSLDQDS